MIPYYSDGCCTIYHGDCREVLPELEQFDLLLTDPPYGIGATAAKYTSVLASQRDYTAMSWDDEPVDDLLLAVGRAKAAKQIIFGGNYFTLPPASCWLIWDKVNGANNFADCEMAWTNLEGAVRLKRHQWHGMLRKGKERRDHPTQKPLEIMGWCLERAGDITSVLDPFMGSGTTLRAAKDRNINAVGIDLHEEYCELAVERLRQEVFAF